MLPVLPDHPNFPELLPHLYVQGDPNKPETPQHRIECKVSLPMELAEKFRDTTACAGEPENDKVSIMPIRERFPRGKRRRFYVSVSCTLGVNSDCARQQNATMTADRVRAAIKGLPPEPSQKGLL